MMILKYIAIDFLGILSFYILNAILYPYLGSPSTYIVVIVVCFSVGLLFNHSVAHGVSIGSEVILMYMIILFRIGRPLSAPISDVLDVGIVGPMLPYIPTGLFAGLAGGKIRKKRKK
jgi:hypothetical protein